MMEENMTLVTEFVLTGLTDRPEVQLVLFPIFLVIYVTTMVGNIGLVVLVWMDSHLHTPMYILLSSLAFADAWTSSSVTPKMLMNFLSQDKSISISECMAQFYFFGASVTAELFLLTVMAYDRYAAICKPLLYPVRMSNRLCSQLVIASYTLGLLHLMIHVVLLFRLTFCQPNIIHHFYCELFPLLKVSCIDPFLNSLVAFIFSLFIQSFTLMTILVSYTFVFLAILRIKSENGRSKAFSTCSAHLLSVSLFFGTLLIMYVCPGSGVAKDQDIMFSLFYTIIIPLLNPFIYSLRNKEVLGSLRKVIKK
ncbi:olfactory receptor 5AC1-like [Monodelphis domestica]|uniref:olfactory receptor 5AC1-like n=1 Tax=Monodelphis domestica TaxID=13616 RepID=UPI00020F724D|nr:olfactory receptor 5AC1-like [Monodelphis domestica]